jgi:hypothetical protein
VSRQLLTLTLVLVVAASGGGCASVAPPVPRFVAVYEQQTAFCTIHVVRDTRSAACFITFRCGHQPVVALAVAPEVCVP